MAEMKKLTCKLLTPLFARGVYANEAEFRTSEVKGMMRYVYRITCLSSSKNLLADEKILFGGTELASPIQLLVRQVNGKERPKTQRVDFLLHKKSGQMDCLENGECQQLIIRMRPLIGKKIREYFDQSRCVVDLDWYCDLTVLSFLLYGMGKRSRKGRGCVVVEEKQFNDKDEVIAWICDTLNRVASVSKEKVEEAYVREGDTISKTKNKAKDKCSHQRTMIQKIEFGEEMEPGNIDNFLRRVDQKCHDIKSKMPSNDKEVLLTAIATGSGNPRMASPLIISLIKIGPKVIPVYTYVNAIYKEKWNRNIQIVDSNLYYRHKFRQAIENEGKQKERAK